MTYTVLTYDADNKPVNNLTRSWKDQDCANRYAASLRHRISNSGWNYKVVVIPLEGA